MQITMRAARVNAGYTQKEASNQFGINIDTLLKYEKDNSKIGRDIIVKMQDLYKLDADDIFFGVESEFIRNLRNG
ncbi:transcriptional regulator [Staphylococcus equorum]|uniref:helix-turn-helix domain-containing protein n=1 Tax=Staphylococcaceae TaxID=90964 RepID=UPI000853B77E|nr:MULTISPECIES: helix-turn-helix transcriptional regulator [Staphylococcaceae]OEK64398.1 transcriptional regulator [Staphylococcus equorum]